MTNFIDSFFSACAQTKVFVVGDVMLDAYEIGSVQRISPEAPVPVLSVEKNEIRLGGAANVALNTVALQAETHLFSVIGSNRKGKKLIELLADAGVNHQGVIQSNNRTTTVKTRLIAGNQQLLRVDEEDTSDLTETEEAQLLAQLTAAFEKHQPQVLILEDYNKGVLTKSVISACIGLAKKYHCKVTVDPKKANFFEYKAVDLFKPNLKELAEALQQKVDASSNSSVQQALQQLNSELKAVCIMVTLSAHGAAILQQDAFSKVAAHVRKIADVSGAGDTVIAVASLALAQNLSATQICELSNLAGGLVCEYPSVVPINKDQFKTEIALKLGHLK